MRCCEMGAYQSKTKNFPAPKPRTRKKTKKKPVYDYLPNSSRGRPRSSQSWREVHLLTLGQIGRSSTSIEELDNKREQTQNIPRWQSKWEIDMRPEPISENKSNLRGWSSMPIPTSRESASSQTTANNKANSSIRRKLEKTRRYELKKASSTLTDVEENDNFERISWRSSKVDGFKMLQKTDGKTRSALQQASLMWQFDSKKSNKTWFLGHDSHLNLENQIVETKKRPVKTRHVFVAQKSKKHWTREM